MINDAIFTNAYFICNGSSKGTCTNQKQNIGGKNLGRLIGHELPNLPSFVLYSNLCSSWFSDGGSLIIYKFSPYVDT